MNRSWLPWILASALASCVVMMMRAAESESPRNLSAAERQDLELELSLARRQADFATQAKPGEEFRDVFARWQEENREALNQQAARREQARRDLQEQAARQAPPPLPQEIPHWDPAADPASFAAQAEETLHQATAAIWHGAASVEELEAARQRFGEWSARPEVGDMLAALHEIRSASSPSSPPVGELPEEEVRVQERLDALRAEIFAEPLKEGEDARDRLGPHQPALFELEAQLDGFARARQAREAQDRVKALEARLAE